MRSLKKSARHLYRIYQTFILLLGVRVFEGYCAAQNAAGFLPEDKSNFERLMRGRFGNMLLFVLGALGLILLMTNSNANKTTANENRTFIGMVCFALVLLVFIYRVYRRFYWYGRVEPE